MCTLIGFMRWEGPDFVPAATTLMLNSVFKKKASSTPHLPAFTSSPVPLYKISLQKKSPKNTELFLLN